MRDCAFTFSPANLSPQWNNPTIEFASFCWSTHQQRIWKQGYHRNMPLLIAAVERHKFVKRPVRWIPIM